METLYYSRYKSAITNLLLGASEKGLLVAEFDRGQFPPAKRAAQWQESPEQLRPYMLELDEYFAGQRRQFSFHLDLRGTFFQLQCWLTLLEIPCGETRTYADIARAIGKPQAFRAVGLANNRNPVAIIVPCHRVIASDGTLCGYGGGLDLKQKLLVLEGARTAHLAA
jgi:methylated-DNA-[protein]-cysteine S-methyltransferase